MPKIEIEISRNCFNAVYFPYIFDYSNRCNVFYGGAGSGKSQFVFSKVLIKALNEKRKVLVVRKVARTNLNSTFQLTMDILSKWKILQYCQVNSSTQKITLPNGSVFLYMGLDDAEKLKSIVGVTDAIIEEATEISLDDYTQIDLRIRAKAENQQIYVIFNPVSKTNWVYKKWFEQPTDAFILKTTYNDNRFLPQDYINSLEQMESTNPVYYKIYALGEFASLDKLVYTNWVVQSFDYKEIEGELCVGLDFGFSADPSALVCSIVTPNKDIYVFDEWYQKGKVNSEIADIIKSKGYAKSIIIADAAEQKSIEEIRRLGVIRIRPCVKGADSIIYGVQKLQQYRIIVSPCCHKTVEELENYTWQKKDGEYINKPIDSFNHILDALRYSIQTVDAAKGKAFDKTLLGL